MAKRHGLGDGLFLGGYDLSGDTNSLGKIGGGIGTIDVTDITQSAVERRGGLRDGGIDWVSYFNPTALKAHATLSSRPTTDRHLMYCRGAALGGRAACLVGKQIDYAPNRGADGSLTIALSAQSNGYGIEWGTLVTAGKRTDTTATSGSSVDFLASTAFGLQAYLQVFSVVGTSVTVALQESSDNGVGDPWAAVTGGAFAAATSGASPQAQRIATGRTLTVERYLRVVTTGTFTSAVFAVAVVKNEVAVTNG